MTIKNNNSIGQYYAMSYVAKRDRNEDELILCSCGCGQIRKRYDTQGRAYDRIKGHHKRKTRILIDCACGCGEQRINLNKCGKEIKFIHGHHTRGKSISDEHKEKIRQYHFKGGIAYHKKGYRMIFMPDHPFAYSNGYVMEHRLVMEKHLGRYLTPQEDVHHINEIKDDNRIDNLQLVTPAEHLNLHRIKKNIELRTCYLCGSNKTVKRYWPSGHIGYQWHLINDDNVLCHNCYHRCRG